MNLFVLIAPLVVVIFSAAILFPIYLGELISPYGHIAATANSIVFSVSWFMSGFLSYLAGMLNVHSVIPFLLLLLANTMFALVIFVAIQKTLVKKECEG